MAIGEAGRGGVGRLSLEELIALNEEIVALVRAGVPLERGLVGAGRDLRGRLGRAAEAVGRRMEDGGRSLAEALEDERAQIPELYGAVVAAGVRAGRLPAALEGLSTFARSLDDLRRTISLALLYPAIVLVAAYGLFVTFVVALAPRLEEGYRSLGATGRAAGMLARLGESAAIWGPIGLGVMGVAAILWMRSGRATALTAVGRGGMLALVPGMRGMIAYARGGMLAELLALLIENRVPLPDALALAARAVGDDRLRSAADRAAEATRRGEDLRVALSPDVARAFPPMLRWLIVGGSSLGDLPGALRLAARTYRDRATVRSELVRLFVPTAMLVGIGGGAVLIYGLTLFVPFAELLRGLG